jgi:hypothetical protein
VERFSASDHVVARVRVVVEEAAAEPLRAGRAEVASARLADVYTKIEYDCPAVLLTPGNPHAAQVVVEIQGDDLWWVTTDDGPGTELHVGMKEDRYEVLESLVRAVVAGRYRHGPCIDEMRRLFRSPRRIHGWCETFDTEDGPRTSRHFGREVPAGERRFQPY